MKRGIKSKKKMKKMIVFLVAYLFVQNIMVAQDITIVNKNLSFGDVCIGELSKSTENSATIYYLTIETKYLEKRKMMLTLGKIDEAIRDVDNLLKQFQSLIPNSNESQQDFEATIGEKTYKFSMMTIGKEIILVVIRPDGELKLVNVPEYNMFRIDRVGETDMKMVFQLNYSGWKVLFAELEKEKKISKKKSKKK